MLLGLLSTNIVLFIAFIIALLIAITLHEASHAAVATLLGDPTAKYQGRLSLNPLRHLDPLGTLMLLIAGFGWGKPVQYNPALLKKGGRWGPFLIAVAGPITNFIIAAFFAAIYKIFFTFIHSTNFEIFIYIIIEINIVLMIFNLLPIPPLDGSKIFYAIPGISDEFITNFERIGVFVLFALIFLNILGILPIFNLVIIPVINFFLQVIFKLPPAF